MSDGQEIDKIKKAKKDWESGAYTGAVDKHGERRKEFMTTSSVPIKPLYTPDDVPDLDYLRDLNFPGQFPFTRGVQATMHRGRLWTMRQFAGFGTAEETNERYKYLLAHGETGLSVAFDFPTLYGRDSDDPLAEGEFGKCGVGISSLRDIETLFDGIPMKDVSTSMTINGPAAVVWGFYIAAAENQGASRNQITGTIQNDILKEYIAQKSWIFPPAPSMRLIVDTFEFGTKEVPRWNTISISGYHIREAGSTALQELAFTLADGLAYVDAAIERGLDLDEFAPRLSFFFNAHNDLFEEIGKYRAARRIWAKEMKKRGAKKDRTMWLRFHTQTAGCSLTAQQPENNIVRTTIQGLAAVLGGTQSLHTNSMDEALALPSEKAVKIALRTQQIIANESGVVNTMDPLAGSYFVEYMTDWMEDGTYKYFDKIEALGGVLKAIDKGFFQQEIANSAYLYQKEIESNERLVVGVNTHEDDNENIDIPILEIDPEGEKTQFARLKNIRETRDGARIEKALEELIRAAEGDANLMPHILEAVKAQATLGETCNALRSVFGEYEEPAIF
ncbi:MAG: methylmalonyl-CoA mutase family protein [Thermoplasmata archaeon]|nr:methylmalonyl-CoA mutase family protein [Thermoplasmata archaeon]